jgi:hypothetical protein
VSAIVRVVDERDDPLRADQVVWYYHSDSGRYDGEHRAQCISAGCTRWGLPAELTGAVYVSASWSRPTSGGCAYNGYDAGLVTPSDDDPPTVTLRLDTRQVTCP